MTTGVLERAKTANLSDRGKKSILSCFVEDNVHSLRERFRVPEVEGRLERALIYLLDAPAYYAHGLESCQE